MQNNVASIGEEERKFQTTIDLKILGYLMGANKNDDQPKITIRETAAEFKFVRERVIMGDKKEY